MEIAKLCNVFWNLINDYKLYIIQYFFYNLINPKKFHSVEFPYDCLFLSYAANVQYARAS